MLWCPHNPKLYTLKVVYGEDEREIPFGIRQVTVSRSEGFTLNGERIILRGACIHSDNGLLGAAAHPFADRRKIELLKAVGYNAVRSAHNPCSKATLDACDRLGMLVLDEYTDGWYIHKTRFDYASYMEEWWQKDFIDMVDKDYNHPSVVMYSTGNEVSETAQKKGIELTGRMTQYLHSLDDTRPVTCGINIFFNFLSSLGFGVYSDEKAEKGEHVGSAFFNNIAGIFGDKTMKIGATLHGCDVKTREAFAKMDVAGFNYRPFRYQVNYKKLPQQIILGSETASTVSSRGVYKFPVERKAMAVYEDHQSSSYDVEHCNWSNLPEDDFIQHEDLPYCIGEFVWTGFDYLGEPTPYYTNWPSHSSLFGIIDLAGIPKDRYYLYRSHWNKSAKTLHILPHWTWPGREGEVTPVFVYTNYPSAELFINGKSQGKRTKDLSIGIDSSYTEAAQKSFERQKRYRLMWMDTKYEPGTLKVVAYDKEGNAVAEEEVHTAGKPHHIELSADRNQLTADGKDLSFINVRVVDKNGNLCPDDTRQIQFKVRGAGAYRAAANGNSASLELFHLPEMKLFSGQLTAIVQTAEEPGTIYFEASAPGVKGATLELISK